MHDVVILSNQFTNLNVNFVAVISSYSSSTASSMVFHVKLILH